MLITHLMEQGTKLLCQLTNNTKMEKGNHQVSSLCVTMLPVKTEYVQNLNSSFLCVFSSLVQLGQHQNSLVMMTGGAATPLQSTGGRHTTLGRLHRHTAFTQLPYGIATECRLRTAGLLPEYQKKKFPESFQLSPLWFQLSSEQQCYHHEEEGRGLACRDTGRANTLSSADTTHMQTL